MKAAVVSENGIGIEEVAEPEPKPNEVKIRVRACGMNRADAMVASGMAHGRAGGPGTVPGIEYVGEVVEIGAEVPNVKPGDRVMCSGTAGWGEYAVADWGRAVPMPANNMSWAQASTLPVALQTMHNALVTAGRFKTGEAVMIQGASTGVGLMGLQIAKAMGASLVVGSSTNPERRERLTEFGADLAVDSRDEGWVDQVLSRFVDVVISIPTLIFALIVLSSTGTSIFALVTVIAIIYAMPVYRIARAVDMDIEVMDYVEAARLRGEGLWWIMRREILPNALTPLAAEFGLRFCFVFLLISGLSFLGLGLQPPLADWGAMVRDNGGGIAWGFMHPLVPATCIALLTIGINLIVDSAVQKASGLREDH